VVAGPAAVVVGAVDAEPPVPSDDPAVGLVTVVVSLDADDEPSDPSPPLRPPGRLRAA
jgi:hypothetical protein